MLSNIILDILYTVCLRGGRKKEIYYFKRNQWSVSFFNEGCMRKGMHIHIKKYKMTLLVYRMKTINLASFNVKTSKIKMSKLKKSKKWRGRWRRFFDIFTIRHFYFEVLTVYAWGLFSFRILLISMSLTSKHRRISCAYTQKIPIYFVYHSWCEICLSKWLRKIRLIDG